MLRGTVGGTGLRVDRYNERKIVNYIVVYSEFCYQADPREYFRRVVCKTEKPTDQMVHMNTFVVTNMDSSPENLIMFYCNRGHMEKFIKEGKNGFGFVSVSSRAETINANRLQIQVLAYNLLNWFRRLVYPKHMRKNLADTIRLKLQKVVTRVIRSARYVTFKLRNSCPYKDEFTGHLRTVVYGGLSWNR